MIEEKKMTPIEIRRAGWEALLNTLGPSGTLKFILDYERGEGNYCEQRKEMFKDKSMQELVQDMKKEGFA